MVVLEEKEFDRRAHEVEEELKTIEGQILDAEPEGPNDAAEILRVVLELTGEDSAVDHRDTALLRQALRALALARHDKQPAKPAQKAPSSTPEAKPTIRDLCRQWEIVLARLNLDMLESSGDDKETDRIIDAARERFRAIEYAILATDPDAIRDVDLVSMLRLARKVIGDDQFIPEQQERCEEMLELTDTTLVRRSDPADWLAPAG